LIVRALQKLAMDPEQEHKDIEKLRERGVTQHVQKTRVNRIECVLTWTDVKYSIFQGNFIQKKLKLEGPTKQILQGIDGYALPGTFLGIIGSSGAGKTTFLNILANRVRTGDISGEILINDVPLKQKKGYQKLIGYVQQQDCLLPFLTVEETLIFSAMLTLPRSLSLKKKMKRVKSLLEELGLDKCAKNFVGDELNRGISGGEKKRLSIGVELLRDPAILFLDEPTSGLDAQIALGVCEHLGRLAHKYRYTVITTIHQPRALIFKEFDLLMILAPGGKQTYFGPASDTMGYFTQHGFECPIHENPADYFIDCISVDFRSPEARSISQDRIENLASAWKARQDNAEYGKLTSSDYPVDPESSHLKRHKTASWLTQMLWITQRASMNEIRNRKFIISRLFQCVIVAVVLGLLYLRIENDQSTIADRNGVLFFALVSVSFNEILAALSVFALQRPVYFRERDSEMYSVSALWFGTSLSLLPYQLLFPGLVAVIVYFMVGLQAEWYKFFIFFAVVELVGLWTAGLGMVLGAACPATVAAALAPLANIMAMLFCGFLVNLDNIPSFIRWLQYISYMKYGFDAIVQNEYFGLTLTCTAEQLVDGRCPITNGSQVVDNLSLAGLEYWQDLLILLLFVVIARLLLLWVLKKVRVTSY